MGDTSTDPPNGEPSGDQSAARQPADDGERDEPSSNHEQVERTTSAGPEPGTRHDTRGERVPEPALDRAEGDGTPDAEVLEEHSRHAEQLETPPTGDPDEHDLRDEESTDAGATGGDREADDQDSE